MAQRQYNTRIEVLRIIGITAIVLYHIACLIPGETTFLKIYKYLSLRQWMWTDVFLALAGYFFYQSFTEKFDNSFIRYMKNRVFRIVPSYYLILIFYLTIGLRLERFVGNNFVMPSTYYWIHFFTFTVNYPLALGQMTGIALEGYFGICILFQFYLIFALLFSFFKKQKYRILILLIFQITAFALRSMSFFQQNEWTSYFFTFTRIDGFIWGVFLFILLKNDKIQFYLVKYRRLITILAITAVITIFLPTNILDVHNIRTASLSTPFITMAIISLLNLIINSKSSESSLYAGDYVYGIYLARLPLIYLVKGIIGKMSFNTHSTNIIFIFSSLAVCIIWGLIFHFVSNRIRTIAVLRR